MGARSVQISLDQDLLTQIDGHRVTKEKGRSAVVSSALRIWLELQRRKAIDDAYVRGYAARDQGVDLEVAELMGGQAWPELDE